MAKRRPGKFRRNMRGKSGKEVGIGDKRPCRNKLHTWRDARAVNNGGSGGK